MNLSVRPTDRLKLVMALLSVLHEMKSRMSGWSTLRIPMLAPRRLPPCFTTPVAASKAWRKDMGPLATPPVDRTTSLLGRSREKLKPVPPPDLWIRAAFLMVSKILSMESSIGRTKQADSCCSSWPAFISVGELKQKSLFLSRRSILFIAERTVVSSAVSLSITSLKLTFICPSPSSLA